MTVQYRLVKADTPADLELRVNSMLQHGWVCRGGVSSTVQPSKGFTVDEVVVYSQAMSRNEPSALVDVLVKEYMRAFDGDLTEPSSLNGSSYSYGWRAATRSVAVQCGVYDEFIKALEDRCTT